MVFKGALDRWLERKLGNHKTPNLPSRLIGCEKCRKVWHVKDLEKACNHRQILVTENLLNYWKSLRS